MAIDVSAFHKHNVADTCAVWNILSSRRLFRAALDAGVTFVCTRVVEYECLLKPCKVTEAHHELRARLQAAQRANDIAVLSLDVDDLHTVQVLERRQRLGKGELSCIALALKTRQAVLTDDQKARRLATEVLPHPGAQTTPHLFGWLFFNNRLSDSDKDSVICDHKQMERPLGIFFETIYTEACRCRWMATRKATPNG